MNKLNKTETYSIRIKPYVLVLALIWSAIVSASLVWNVYQARQGTLDVARIQARDSFMKDVIYRRWNAKHGGVYAPVTENTPPNPYLNVPERDIITPQGQKLTKINPAYMTRQVHVIAAKAYGIRGHITSLNPIRPANAPDPWEAQALKTFKYGAKEASSIEKVNGNDYMRLMRPLMTESGCLKCHAAQGYKVGDIRGGISVSVPMSPLWAVESSNIMMLSLGHGLLWMIGLMGIGFGTHRLSKQITERKKAEEALQKSQERLETILHSMPVGIMIIDAEIHKIVDVNPMATLMIGAPIEQIIGSQCYDFICTAEKSRCPITDLGRSMDNSEHVLLDVNRKSVPILKTVIPIEIDDRKYLIEGFVDISEHKRAEQERIEKEKLQGVIEMAGAVCHEMNQPLMAISGYSELIVMDASKRDPISDKAVKIKNQIDRLGKITQKLMTITSYKTKDYLNSKIIDIDKATK